MIFLTIVTYIGLIVQLLFATISIAAGLYYVAELVEEYTVLTKKCITILNWVVLSLFVCLWLFESFPTPLIVCGISAQITHFFILHNFPLVSFTSPSFIISIAFILINHYLAFNYFGNNIHHTFSEIMAYFTLCLWLVPFSLFVSLSANDNVLPTTADRLDGNVVTNYISKNKKYGLLSLFSFAKESILPYRTKKGF